MGIVARLAMLTLTPLVTRPLTNLLDVWTAAGACTIQHHVRGCRCLMLPSALAVASHQLQAAVALTCHPASATCNLMQLPSGHRECSTPGQTWSVSPSVGSPAGPSPSLDFGWSFLS